ncbi:MAG TPA: hypothetical protein VFQ61_28840 [Polyangiaceae bacterium]|nr:hypothetical protein [Polyangiaceae bacterium]
MVMSRGSESLRARVAGLAIATALLAAAPAGAQVLPGLVQPGEPDRIGLPDLAGLQGSADWQEPGTTPVLFGNQRAPNEDAGTKKPGERLRFGPVLGAGFPNVISVGATLKINQYVGAGVNWGMIPEMGAPGIESTTLTYREYDVYGRVYPFGDALFAGLGVGYEEISTATAQTLQLRSSAGSASLNVSGEASVKSLILIPQIGIFHTFESGFSLGSEVGVQLPISASDVTLTEDPAPTAAQRAAIPALGQTEDKVVNTLRSYSKTPIPTIGFRVGWLL